MRLRDLFDWKKIDGTIQCQLDDDMTFMEDRCITPIPGRFVLAIALLDTNDGWLLTVAYEGMLIHRSECRAIRQAKRRAVKTVRLAIELREHT